MQRISHYLGEPFSDYYEIKQNILYEKLTEAGLPEAKIKDALASGYYMRSGWDLVYDSYYAPQWGNQGQFSFECFVECLNKAVIPAPMQSRISEIRSVDEIVTILNEDPHSKHCLEHGSLTFRGQNEEYFTRRVIPNPTFADQEGNERLIIPNIYRKYKDNFQNRIIDEKPHDVFNTVLADDLIYYGMEHPSVISKRNYEKYGYHTMSDLQDFPEPENQEYYKRWSQLKVQALNFPDVAVVAQHYGYHTYGLDLTFDPEVAAFFASHKFEWKANGKADFLPINSGEHQGVIYCFYFRAPQVTKTRDIIHSLPAFDYILPLRPIRQSCALPFFLFDRFNEANQFIWHIFKLHPDFDSRGLPSKEFLFPSQDEDKFYKAAMDVKQKNQIWSDFVEYDFPK